MSNIRTFIAVDVSSASRQRAAELIERLRGSGADVKWVRPENLHLTLNFLGGVPESLIMDVCRTVSRAAEAVGAFELHCRGAGAFPSVQRPRTVWLGVDEGQAELTELQKVLAERLDELGYPPEHRQFHPHLTLGRIRRPGPGLERLSELLEEHASYDARRSSIQEVVVYASALGRGGPKYDALGRCPLGD